MRAKITKLAKELIKISSISTEKKKVKQALGLALAQFNGRPVHIKEYQSQGSPSAVVSLRRGRNPGLLLVGHLDVAPALPVEFKPRLAGQRLYGRGACDMKTAVAVMILFLHFLSDQAKPPSVGLMLTGDEELGGANGVGYLLAKKKYVPRLAIIPDGNLDLGFLTIAEKGVLHLKIKARGQAAHASRPWLGKNALERLIAVYESLRRAIPEIKPGQWRPSLNLSQIRGGEAVNSVPDYAEMFLDVRYCRLAQKDLLLNKIRKIAPAMEVVISALPFSQSPGNNYFQQYKGAAEAVLAKKIKYYRSEGGSDARYFSEHNIPAVVTRIGGGNHHATGEWVSLKEAEKFYFILKEFTQRFFK